jgi:formylglycine-generating enzyme required for sulfatase activity
MHHSSALSSNYPCDFDGDNCTNIYARSVAGVLPSRFMSWFQAAQACRNAGKRLLTNAEWQMGAAGTPDPGLAGDGTTTCNTNSGGPGNTGDTGNCSSSTGVRDMVGNLSEFVADWLPDSTACPSWGFTDDEMCLAGASATSGPDALVRGGGFNWSRLGGQLMVFPFELNIETTTLGFRCAR